MPKQLLTKKQFFSLTKHRNLTLAEKERRWKQYIDVKSIVLNKTQKNIPRPVRIKQPALTSLKLSQCLRDYIKASIDPFDLTVNGVCIPDDIVVPSFKFSVTLNGQMVIGTTGVGYAALNPFTAVCSDNTDSNPGSINIPLILTTATYDQPGLTLDPALFTGARITTVNSSSFFTTAQLRYAQMRLVASGLELAYTGQLLNQSGAVSSQQWPGTGAPPQETLIAQIRNDPRTVTCTVSKDSRCYIPYTPTDEEYRSYQYPSYYRPRDNAAIGNSVGVFAPMFIIVTGATPGTTFQVKAVSHFEVQMAGMAVTPSHGDPNGYASFQSARTMVNRTDNPHNDTINLLKATVTNLATNISGYLPEIGMAVGGAFGAPELGYAAGGVGKSLLNELLKQESAVI
jgi:hypothetical protein